MDVWWNPQLKNQVCRIHHGFHKLSRVISFGWCIGVPCKSKPYLLRSDTLVCSQKASPTWNQWFIKHYSHLHGQIKDLRRKEQINGKILSLCKRPHSGNRTIHKASVHNYVFIALWTMTLTCNFMVSKLAILRPKFFFGFVCCSSHVWFSFPF